MFDKISFIKFHYRWREQKMMQDNSENWRYQAVQGDKVILEICLTNQVNVTELDTFYSFEWFTFWITKFGC